MPILMLLLVNSGSPDTGIIQIPFQTTPLRITYYYLFLWFWLIGAIAAFCSSPSHTQYFFIAFISFVAVLVTISSVLRKGCFPFFLLHKVRKRNEGICFCTLLGWGGETFIKNKAHTATCTQYLTGIIVSTNWKAGTSTKQLQAWIGRTEAAAYIQIQICAGVGSPHRIQIEGKCISS